MWRALGSEALQRHVRSWRREGATLRVMVRQSWQAAAPDFRRFWEEQEGEVKVAMVLTPLHELPSSLFGPFLPVACPELLHPETLAADLEPLQPQHSLQSLDQPHEAASTPPATTSAAATSTSTSSTASTSTSTSTSTASTASSSSGGGGGAGGGGGRRRRSKMVELMEAVAAGRENAQPAFDGDALAAGLAPLLGAAEQKAAKDTLLLVRSCLLLNFCHDILLLWQEAANDPSILIVDD